MQEASVTRKLLLLNQILARHSSENNADPDFPWTREYQELESIITDYQGFLQDFFEEPEFVESFGETAVAIAWCEAKFELLTSKNDVSESTKRLAHMRCKLLFRLRHKLPENFNFLIDEAKKRTPAELVEKMPISLTDKT